MAANLVDFAKELKRKIPIDLVIADYVPDLVRRGRSVKARCPFHEEKTPSFNVNVEMGFYHCFGCGAHGDSIKFIQEYEKVDFPLAVETLAKKFGVAIPEFERGGGPRVDRDEREKTREALLAVSKAAEAFFIDQFWKSPKAEPAREYMRSRGLTDEELRTYRIGFAPPEYEAFLQHARRSGYGPERVAEAGLAIAKESGGFIDRFRNRIIFPITDREGRVVAFGGRLIEGEGPKYLNSSDSPIFHKGRLLYGLAAAREPIRREGRVILLEGYMDWIALHSGGVQNALAGLGTAFTEDQARMIRSISAEVALAYDGDAAGRKAAFRAAELLLAQGLGVRVVSLPDGHDPDSFLREKGRAAMTEAIDRSRQAMDFFLDEAVANWPPGTPESKYRAVEFLSPLLGALKEPVLRDAYLARVASRLGLDSQTIEKALARKGRPAFERAEAPPEGESAPGSESAPARPAEVNWREIFVINRLIRMVHRVDLFERVDVDHEPWLRSDLFSGDLTRRVFEAIRTAAFGAIEGVDPPSDPFELAETNEERDLIARALLIENESDIGHALAEGGEEKWAIEIEEFREILFRAHSRRARGIIRSRTTSGGHEENRDAKQRLHTIATRITRELDTRMGSDAREKS